MSIVLALIGLFVFPLLGVALFHYVRDVLRWYGTGDPHPRVAWLAVGAGMVACLVVAAVWVAWSRSRHLGAFLALVGNCGAVFSVFV